MRGRVRLFVELQTDRGRAKKRQTEQNSDKYQTANKKKLLSDAQKGKNTWSC